MEEANVEENKINFFKKIYYSLFKIKKYNNLINEGLKSAIKYFIIISCISVIIPTLIAIYKEETSKSKLINELEENLPTLEYKEGILNAEEVCIIDNGEVKDLFKCNIVINTDLDEDEALVNEYGELVSEDFNCIIFQKDKIKIFELNEEDEQDPSIDVKIYDYQDVLKSQIKDLSEFNKQDIIEYFKNSSIFINSFNLFIVYAITILTVLTINLFIVWILSIGASKIFKVESKIKRLFTTSIYASTLSNLIYLIYFIASMIFNLELRGIDLICITIAYIYLLVYLIPQNKELFKNNKKEA